MNRRGRQSLLGDENTKDQGSVMNEEDTGRRGNCREEIRALSLVSSLGWEVIK